MPRNDLWNATQFRASAVLASGLALCLLALPMSSIWAGPIAIHWTGSAEADYEASYLTPETGDLLGSAARSIFRNGELDGILDLPSAPLSVGAQVDAWAKAHGRVNVKAGGSEWNLGVDAFAQSEWRATTESDTILGLISFSEVAVTSTFSDRFRLRGDGTLPIIGSGDEPVSLKLKFEFDGQFSHNLDSLTNSFVTGRAQLIFKHDDLLGAVDYNYGRDGYFEPVGDENVRFNATFSATLGSSPFDWLDYRLTAGLQLQSQNGWIRGNFGNTAKLIGIEFEDGTTPEQRGFTIEFESGLTSPNLLRDDPPPTPVPEPSSVALLACGAIGLLIVQARRKRSSRPQSDR